MTFVDLIADLFTNLWVLSIASSFFFGAFGRLKVQLFFASLDQLFYLFSSANGIHSNPPCARSLRS